MDGGGWWAAVHGVAKNWTRLSNFTLTFHFHALEKEMATHSSVLAWRIPGMEEPGRLPSMGSHRVRHNWSNLAAAAAAAAAAVALSVKTEIVCFAELLWELSKIPNCLARSRCAINTNFLPMGFYVESREMTSSLGKNGCYSLCRWGSDNKDLWETPASPAWHRVSAKYIIFVFEYCYCCS